MANDKPVIECENALEDEIAELERRLQHAKARLKAVKLDDGSAQLVIAPRIPPTVSCKSLTQPCIKHPRCDGAKQKKN